MFVLEHNIRDGVYVAYSVKKCGGLGHIPSGLIIVLMNQNACSASKYCCIIMNNMADTKEKSKVCVYLLLVVFTIGRLQRFL